MRSSLLLNDCLNGLEGTKKFEFRYDHEVIEYIVLVSNRITEKGIDIILAWIPGHVWIAQNEDAYKIARNATIPETIFIQKSATPKIDAKTEIKRYCMKLWEDHNKRITVQYIPMIYIAKSDINLLWNCKHRLLRLSSGHYR